MGVCIRVAGVAGPLLFLLLFVMPDDFGYDEAQEFLGEIGVQIGIFGQLKQAFDLFNLAARVRGWQVVAGLQGTNRLRSLKPFGQGVDEDGVQIVDVAALDDQQFSRACYVISQCKASDVVSGAIAAAG